MFFFSGALGCWNLTCYSLHTLTQMQSHRGCRALVKVLFISQNLCYLYMMMRNVLALFTKIGAIFSLNHFKHQTDIHLCEICMFLTCGWRGRGVGLNFPDIHSLFLLEIFLPFVKQVLPWSVVTRNEVKQGETFFLCSKKQ